MSLAAHSRLGAYMARFEREAQVLASLSHAHFGFFGEPRGIAP